VISTFQIFNYKSFVNSGEHRLGPGMNVIVGANNSGKTALIEILGGRFQPIGHRSTHERRDNNSHISVRFDAHWNDLKGSLVQFKDGRHWVLAPAHLGEPELVELLKNGTYNIDCTLRPGGGFSVENWGVNTRGISERVACLIGLNDTGDIGLISVGPYAEFQDTLGGHIVQILASKIFSFDAERLNVSRIGFSEEAVLTSNASNLPRVLSYLQGKRPVSFDQLNAQVRAIFPTVMRVSVAPVGSELEIFVWTADPSIPELARPLSECGTGIGKVIAIMTALISSQTPYTIIIDEPNTFLHPAAARSLFEFMKTNPIRHQYVFTTHSPEIIAYADPDELLLIKWVNEQSVISTIDRHNILGQRSVLEEVGARFSDIFGADHVLWVEGLTEQACFPQIIRQFSPQRLLATAIVAVRNTGDLEARRANAQQTWEIYERLTTVGGLLPVAVAFSLDQEGRSPTVMEDLRRRAERSGTHLKFLPRRTYENYLLHPEAISAVLGRAEYFRGEELEVDRVRTWLIKNGGKYYNDREWKGDLTDATWLEKVNAPALLRDLYSALSETTEPYDKLTDSVDLTEWLLENDRNHLSDLAAYLDEILSPGGTG
jgi:hypothetical protein